MSGDGPSEERRGFHRRNGDGAWQWPTPGWTRHVRNADATWLGAGLVAGILLYLAYLSTHAYPAYGAGLFLQIAEEIRVAGYALPTTVPGYTAGGVPLAYPPLGFYVAALVGDVGGVEPISYARFVPGIVLLVALVPYFYSAKALLGSGRTAGIATVLFVSTPAVLQWHLSAGGMVRSLAFLFVLLGLYVGIGLFDSGDRRLIPPAALLFGLTVLTHPTYTVFFALTYLLLFATYGRSPKGLLSGVAVAAGGFLLATPWLVQVVRHHGVDVFTAAAGTHSGLGGGVGRFVAVFGYPLAPDLETVFFVAAYLGALYALRRRRVFLPAWLVAAGYVVGKHRFIFVAGSMLTALFLVEGVAPAIARRVSGNRDRIRAVVVAVVLVASMGTATGYATGAVDTESGVSSASQPSFVDDDDRSAMTWVSETTSPSAEFVVLGDAAEWFPLLTDRTILVGPWGVEWTTAERYQHQLELYRSISTCGDAACLSDQLAQSEVSPDYVYVPRDEYTVRGHEYHQRDGMRDSMIAAEEYRLVYENDGVMVFRVTDSSSGR